MKLLFNNKPTPKPTYIDMLFVGRNTAYGAYELRKNYSKRLLKGLLVLLCSGVVSISLTARKSVAPHIPKTHDTVVIHPLELIDPPEIIREEIEKPHVAEASQADIKALPNEKDFIVEEDKDIPKETIEDTKDNVEKELPISANGNEGTKDVTDNENLLSIGKGDGDGLTGGDNDNDANKNNGNTQSDGNTNLDKTFDSFGVDKNPEYPGGENALEAYLAKNINYPEMDRANNREGRVLVQFVVDESGNVEAVKILTKATPDMNAEAKRVVKKMPQWTPALYNGKPVKCYFEIPITFQLDVD